jgi:hypothetical protein
MILPNLKSFKLFLHAFLNLLSFHVSYRVHWVSIICLSILFSFSFYKEDKQEQLLPINGLAGLEN